MPHKGFNRADISGIFYRFQCPWVAILSYYHRQAREGEFVVTSLKRRGIKFRYQLLNKQSSSRSNKSLMSLTYIVSTMPTHSNLLLLVTLWASVQEGKFSALNSLFKFRKCLIKNIFESNLVFMYVV